MSVEFKKMTDCRFLPVYTFGMWCKADTPLVYFQSSALGRGLGLPPAAGWPPALDGVEVLQNAAETVAVKVTH